VLVAAADAAEMSPIEIIFQVVQLIVAGTDTARVAIVMQVALLLQHHEQWMAVCRDPGLIPAAVEEPMRWAGLAGWMTGRLMVAGLSPINSGMLPIIVGRCSPSLQPKRQAT
jgi:cytochrome P450